MEAEAGSGNFATAYPVAVAVTDETGKPTSSTYRYAIQFLQPASTTRSFEGRTVESACSLDVMVQAGT
jgi:hypothetical protein